VRDGLSLLDQAMAQWEPESGTIQSDFVADMLGLADRTLVFDLLEAVMAGKPAAALGITERAHERGADLGVLLADLLDLLHSITRIKSVPGLRDSPELAEAERTRGAALADALSVPVLGRAWQMLLKGVAEVEAAPDRRAAAEMVLIRLCHVSEMPTPGDLVRRLSGTAQAPDPTPTPPGGGGGMRAVGGTAMAAIAPAMGMPDALPVNAPPASFRAMAAMVAEQREAMLHAHLLHSVHLVRYAPPVIELRPEPAAPRDLAARLAAFLTESTGTRWTIALSAAAGSGRSSITGGA
jgi:DNA polymerase-3 subunit gamma/tau